MSGFPGPSGGQPYNSFPRMGAMPFRPPGPFGPQMAGNMMRGIAPGNRMPGMPRMAGGPMAGNFPGPAPGAGFLGPGPPAPAAPPPLLPGNPLGPKPASTVYVGKIASSIPDDVVRELLEACGTIKSWNPVKEPSGVSKGFGFCEYEDADGALRALRLLHNLAVDGQELLLKPNTATQKYLVWYEQQKEVRRRKQHQEAEQRKARKEAEAEKKAAAAADAEGTPAGDEGDEGHKEKAASPEPIDEAAQEQATDDLALTIIMGVVSNRPAPPATGEAAAAAAEKKEEGRRSSHREEDTPRTSSPSGRQVERARDDDAAREAALEAEFDRERKRERAMQEEQHRRQERELQRRLDGWERHERSREKDREREKDRLRDMERERARYIKADNEGHESDDERERWQRRSLRHSRRMEERRKRRLRELEEDAADRAKDQEQQAEAEAKAAPSHPVASPAANGVVGVKAEPPSPAFDGGVLHDVGLVKGESDIQQDPGHKQEQQQEDDAIFQAMQAAAFGAAPGGRGQQRTVQQAVAQASPQQQQQQLPAQAPGRTALVGKRPNRAAVSALFGDDDDDTSKRRKLVPIQYSEEEIKAVEDHSQALSDAAAQAAAVAAAGSNPQQQQQQPEEQQQDLHYPAFPEGLDLSGCKAFLRQWMDTLPNTRDPLYAFPVRWQFMAESSLSNIGAWVAKKVPELVGMEEPDLVEFIMSHVRNRAAAETMESELSPILMQDTVGFVMKLKRLVVYECERNALQKSFGGA